MRGLLVSGWALDHRFWRPLVERLERSLPGWEWEPLDLGFGGETPNCRGHYDLAVGHSLGWMWLVKESGIDFDRLISISGFTRFAQSDSFPDGVAPRSLDRMQRQLARDPGTVLNDFWNRCGGLPDSLVREMGKLDPDRLNWGLDALKCWDLREQWNARNLASTAWLAIAASDDAIVTRAMTTSCFAAADICWIDSPSHLLPLSHADQCASLIQQLVSL